MPVSAARKHVTTLAEYWKRSC